MDAPETRYARSGDVSIAYQVVGAGPIDLVYVPGFVSNIDVLWEHPSVADALGRLASFSRLIVFDKRGTGLSDRVAIDRLPTLEERMDDVRAVMDAAGSARAAIFGHSEGGAMSLLFAATYPDRASSLITYGAFAKRIRSDDYPWAPTLEARRRSWEEVAREWGTAEFSRAFVQGVAASLADDEAFVRWLSSYLRKGASPAAASALMRMNSYTDVRDVLPAIRVPALIVHGSADDDVRIEESRYIASRIPHATLVEIPGGEHVFWTARSNAIFGEIQEFLTGAREAPEPDRFLATALFTDIVEGTRKAAELGDARWRSLVEDHHALVRRELERFRGREVDTAGDGFFATFDGPGRAIRCAASIRDGVRRLGIQIRAGLHTGECEEIAGKVGGIAVITAARVRERAEPGEVLASSTVRDLVHGSGIEFAERGVHALKGIPGEWRLYRVAKA
ncbi:MAG TPA: adenylate/guanylate cyclase domain-containing protein [Candidatus Limnocylindria bacterium]